MEPTRKDEALIALLKVDARQSVVTLARKLGLSRTTVQDRLSRLENAGIICGYGVRLSLEAAGSGMRAIVDIAVESRRTGEVATALRDLSEVEALHTVSGKFDYVAQVRTSSPERMDALLDAIGMIEGITRTQSSIILSTRIDRR